MVAAPVATYCYSSFGPFSVVILLACAPLAMHPLVYLLKEEKDVPIQSTRAQLSEIWNTICSRSVWQPMAFVYLFNLLQVQNVAWRQYLKTVLGFRDAELNTMLVASYVCLFLGTIVYKFFFLTSSWRRTYQVCILFNAVLTALQLLLIQGKTFGLSDFWFALGDEAAAEFITGIQFLVRGSLRRGFCSVLAHNRTHECLLTYTTLALNDNVCHFVSKRQ